MPKIGGREKLPVKMSGGNGFCACFDLSFPLLEMASARTSTYPFPLRQAFSQKADFPLQGLHCSGGVLVRICSPSINGGVPVQVSIPALHRLQHRAAIYRKCHWRGGD